MMRPVSGSRPPQKLKGSSSRSGAADAAPGESGAAANMVPLTVAPPVSANCAKSGERAAVRSSRPSPDLSPRHTGSSCGEVRDRPGVFHKPQQLHGLRARTSKEGSGSMPQETRIVGLDVAKSKVDACIHSLGLRLSARSTPEGEAKLVALCGERRPGRPGGDGGERRLRAQLGGKTLRAAGLAVRVVDPKRVRHFAKAAGRLAKNDPIDAETIARFAEALPRRQRPTARSRAVGARPSGSGPGSV